MSAIISWTSWKLAIGTAELPALLRVGDRGVDAALADPDAAGGDAVAAASRARDIAILKPSPTSPSIASSGTSTSSSESSAVSEARSPSLPWISCDGEALAGRSGRGSRRGRGASSPGRSGRRSARPRRTLPSEIHIFWPVIVQPPSVFVGAGAQVGGVGAGVGLGQAEAAERLARAQPRQPVAASAPRCPSARSSRRRARSAPRRPCAPRSRRGRSPRRSARS